MGDVHDLAPGAPRKARGRKSTLAQYGDAIQDAANELIRAGHTIDDIVATLRGMGAPVSRSATGRYVKSARESMQRYREAQEVAKVWLDKLEAEPNGDVARLMPEMLRALAFTTMSTMGDSADPTSPQELMFLAKAVKDLSSASKANVDIELRMRQERERARLELLAEQNAKLQKLGSSGGITEDTRALIRAELGI